MELSSCRQLGMAVGPIPFLDILEYCMIHGIVGSQREDFLWFVQRLDQKYLEWSSTRGKSG